MQAPAAAGCQAAGKYGKPVPACWARCQAAARPCAAHWRLPRRHRQHPPAALAQQLGCQWRPGRQLDSRPAPPCRRQPAVSCSAAHDDAGPGEPPAGPRPAQAGGPPGLRDRLLRVCGAAALLAVAGLLGWSRPALARQRLGSGAESASAAQVDSRAAQQPEAASASASASASEPQRQHGWRDSGLQLAQAATEEAEAGAQGRQRDKADTRGMGPAERRALRERVHHQMEGLVSERDLRRLTPAKKGKKVDTTVSAVPDPNTFPTDGKADFMAGTVGFWRPEGLRDMTYTRFWNLVRERQVDQVKFTRDRRAAWVTTKATAPGGARTEKVGLPFDPELFDHLVTHSVHIEETAVNRFQQYLAAVIRAAFPIFFSWYLVKFSFQLGRKKKRDKIFGGARLELVKETTASFADVAGIDQVKEEIMELVQFLRSPQRFLALGARAPAGVLLVGAPGTGKTLLARAIAGEAGVPFFSASGTEFQEVYVGVGASRVRDMFEKCRKAAPCILFIDEFDGVGEQRSYSSSGDDESVHTINQLLTEMDGFDDNTGLVVMAATNRPAALDSALTRPGRFDRIIHMPLPNLEGRIEILKVHARDKRVVEGLEYSRVARATAGFTGAELMNLMNQAAILTVRMGRNVITEKDIFDALELIQREKMGQGGTATQYEEEPIPPLLRRAIAVYEAGRALIGFITPYFDEVSKVAICPGNVATGYTYFIPQEEHLESRVVTRGFMEARLTVALAGRAAERLVLGEAHMSTAGGSDIESAHAIAREMVYKCGFSKRLGPVALMQDEEVYLNRGRTQPVADIGTELARIALAECEELVEAAEAKAYYGLTINYRALEALVNALLERGELSGAEVRTVVEGAGLVRFPDPFVEGFTWDQDGRLAYPGMPTDGQPRVQARQPTDYAGARAGNGDGAGQAATVGADDDGAGGQSDGWWSAGSPYRVRLDLPDLLCKEVNNL